MTPPGSRHDHIARQLEEVLRSEIGKVVRAGRDLSGVRWHPVAPDASPVAQIAIVAADAGNVQLRLVPLQAAFVRVASSASEEPLGEAVFPADLPAPPKSRCSGRPPGTKRVSRNWTGR